MRKITLSLLFVTIFCFSFAQNQRWDDQFVPANSVNNTVYCVKSDVLNNVYVSGTFTTAGGNTANYVAKWDGSAWTSLGTGFNGPVYAIETWGNFLVAGGLFTQADGAPALNIAIWTGTAWTAAGTGINGVVRTIKFYDPYVYIGGEFTLANGVAVSNICRTNGLLWENMSGGVNGPVYSIDIRNFVFTGGKFSMAGSTSVSNVATWNGTTWGTLADGLNDTVYTVKFTVNGLYAGGAFTQSGTTALNRVAMYDAGLWKPLGDGLDNSVFSLAISDSLIYAGGLFQNSGTVPVNRVAKYSNSQWSPLGDGTNASVRTMSLLGFDLYCGGAFSQAGSKPSNFFGRYGASPVILYQPQNITVCEGEVLEIGLDTWSSETVTHVWKKDGSVISVPDNDTLIIDPVTLSDAGIYTCEMTNIFGTSVTTSVIVTVNALPALILEPSDVTLCEGDSLIWLTNASSGLPVVYNWYQNSNHISGVTVPELVFGGVVPADAGVYFIIVENACGTDQSADFSLTVNALPPVNISGLLPEYCFTGSSDTIIVTPTGGTLSGPNLNGDIFTPYGLVGDHIFSYTYTDLNGCSATDEYTIHVFNPTSATISGYDVFYCLAAPNDTLQGSPAGGYFAGTGMNDSIFSPFNAGEGTFDISYYYLDTNNCINGDTVPIVVMQQVAFTYIGLDTVLCANEMPYTIVVFPPNGTFSGNALINGNQFDPVAAGIGLHEVVYQFNDPWGCSGTDTIEFEVIQGPHATITNLPINVCNNAAPFVLNGVPSGGDYQGLGVNDSLFSPSTLQPGITSVFYYVTDTTLGCSDTAVILTEVLFVEQAFLTGLQPVYCQFEPNDTLSGIPAGGSFIGPGVTGNIFSSHDAGTGNHTIMYVYQNPNECLSIDSLNISVFDNPSIAVGQDFIICQGDSVNITAVYDSANQLFWSTGDSTDNITVQPPASILVIGTVFDGVCFNADTVDITVNPVPMIDLNDSLSFCNTGLISAPAGMDEYLWSTGNFSQNLNISVTDTYSVTITNSYGCTGNDSVFAEVLPGPIVELGINRVITEDQSITFIVDNNYDLYLWSDGSTDYSMFFDGAVYGVGMYTVWVFAQNDNGCYDTDTVLVTVNPGIFVESSLYDNQIKLFPNPATMFVNVDFGELSAPDQIRICDVSGKESQVLSVNTADVPGTIDISRLESGLYLVHFYFGEVCVIKKLFVK